MRFSARARRLGGGGRASTIDHSAEPSSSDLARGWGTRLYGRRAGLRAATSRSGAGRVRLSRALPRADHRRSRLPIRRDRLLHRPRRLALRHADVQGLRPSRARRVGTRRRPPWSSFGPAVAKDGNRCRSAGPRDSHESAKLQRIAIRRDAFRRNRTQEVADSSPASSMKDLQSRDFCFRF